jgi:Ca2+-binding RTX toxin-like protein
MSVLLNLLGSLSTFNLLFGTKLDDNLTATTGNDIIVAGKGDDVVNAGTGNDILTAGKGDDWIFSGKGNDIIWGRDGNDVLFGGKGDDRIMADAGNDHIWAGDGNDLIAGGAGNDIFHFDRNDGYDQIVDFVSGVDKIDLGLAFTKFSKLDIESVNGGTLIEFNNTSIFLKGVASVSASDFIF